uniref:SAM domain-containing protein n=1 Tax=Cyprinus carpio TaxID=7962 RepID=A0A8C2C5W9_CYPCA
REREKDGRAERKVMILNFLCVSRIHVIFIYPVDWTVADVASYFTAAGFPEQALAFRTQEIDGKSLLLMQRNDVLTGLSIRLGPALKIYERHVKVLQRTHFQDDEAFC